LIGFLAAAFIIKHAQNRASSVHWTSTHGHKYASLASRSTIVSFIHSFILACMYTEGRLMRSVTHSSASEARQVIHEFKSTIATCHIMMHNAVISALLLLLLWCHHVNGKKNRISAMVVARRHRDSDQMGARHARGGWGNDWNYTTDMRGVTSDKSEGRWKTIQFHS
jgi:hypothetical protein